MSSSLQSVFDPWILFLADDPALRALQFGMLLVGVIVIFLVFYTTRDILLRTHSFWYMLISIILVAALPIVGFFLYLLIRPPRTIKERDVEDLLLDLALKKSKPVSGKKRGGIVKKKKSDSSS